MRTALATTFVVLCLAAWGSAQADGAALYKENCARCHGDDGAGETPVAKAMNVPSIKGTSMSAEAIATFAVEDEKHKSAASKLSPEDLAAIGEAVTALK